MNRVAKIVATLGPSSSDETTLRELITAGMDVARLNFSHGNAESTRQMAELVRRVAREEKRFVALMGDLQGPKIRVGTLPEDGVWLEEGHEVVLTSGSVADPRHEIPFPHPDIVFDLRMGDHILLDDGTLELEVLSVAPPAATSAARCGSAHSSRI